MFDSTTRDAGSKGETMSRLVAFFRRRENWPILIIPTILMLWARLGAIPLGFATYDSALLYNSPYRELIEPGQAGDPIARQVVIVVVDGLREDVSRQMPPLNALRQQGADRTLQAGALSFSLPGWTVIGTGAWQETNGFNSNDSENSIEIDTIFLAARRAGLHTALVGPPDWKQLYGGMVDDMRVLDLPSSEQDVDENLDVDATSTGTGIDLLLTTKPNLILIHLPGADRIGHGYGGTSDEYRRVAMGVDEQIARLLAAVDLNTTAILITADHGHTDRGGHGGTEPSVLRVPLVSVGKGIRPGVYPDAFQVDIAPTVAVLLGTSFPAHNQGDPLWDQIEAPGDVLASRAVDHADQMMTRYDSMLAVIGASERIDRAALEQSHDTLVAGDHESARAQAEQVVKDARDLWSQERAARMNRERLVRLLIALLILGPVGLYLAWWRRARWTWRVPLLGALLFFVLWNLNYFLIRRLSYSISWFNHDDEIEPFFETRVTEALVALLVGVLVVAVLRRRAAPGEVARDAVHTMFLVGLGLLLQILWFYVLWNITFAWYLPDAVFGFKYYMDVFQTTVFWPMWYVPVAALLPLLAVGAAWLANWMGGKLVAASRGGLDGAPQVRTH